MKKTNKIAIITSSVAAIGVIGVGSTYTMYKAPYSYVSMDINPSIEMELNRFDNILKVNSANEDAEKVLKNIDLKNLKIDEGIKIATKTMYDTGYFEDFNNEVIVAVSSKNKEKANILVNEIKSTIVNSVPQDSEKENTINIETLTVNKDDVEKAKKLNVTAGKLNLIEEIANTTGEEVTSHYVNQWKNTSVKDIKYAQKLEKELLNELEEKLKEIEHIKGKINNPNTKDIQNLERDLDRLEKEVKIILQKSNNLTYNEKEFIEDLIASRIDFIEDLIENSLTDVQIDKDLQALINTEKQNLAKLKKKIQHATAQNKAELKYELNAIEDRIELILDKANISESIKDKIEGQIEIEINKLEILIDNIGVYPNYDDIDPDFTLDDIDPDFTVNENYQKTLDLILKKINVLKRKIEKALVTEKEQLKLELEILEDSIDFMLHNSDIPENIKDKLENKLDVEFDKLEILIDNIGKYPEYDDIDPDFTLDDIDQNFTVDHKFQTFIENEYKKIKILKKKIEQATIKEKEQLKQDLKKLEKEIYYNINKTNLPKSVKDQLKHKFKIAFDKLEVLIDNIGKYPEYDDIDPDFTLGGNIDPNFTIDHTLQNLFRDELRKLEALKRKIKNATIENKENLERELDLIGDNIDSLLNKTNLPEYIKDKIDDQFDKKIDILEKLLDSKYDDNDDDNDNDDDDDDDYDD